MLSDEEKKAIESLIEIREFANLSSYKDTKISQLNAIDVVLNLIKKQSKEIEELKKYEKYYEEMEEVNKKFIAVDKIKAKIKEYYEYDKRMQSKPDWHTTKYYEAKALEKLLEE